SKSIKKDDELTAKYSLYTIEEDGWQ
ncbi:uncharacterized protein METZ01_LOCUS470248, partial [marine metagenome]